MTVGRTAQPCRTFGVVELAARPREFGTAQPCPTDAAYACTPGASRPVASTYSTYEPPYVSG
jgi:hypothetical protein